MAASACAHGLHHQYLLGLSLAALAGPNAVSAGHLTCHLLQQRRIRKRSIAAALGELEGLELWLAHFDEAELREVFADADAEALSEVCRGFVDGAALHPQWMADLHTGRILLATSRLGDKLARGEEASRKLQLLGLGLSLEQALVGIRDHWRRRPSRRKAPRMAGRTSTDAHRPGIAPSPSW